MKAFFFIIGVMCLLFGFLLTMAFDFTGDILFVVLGFGLFAIASIKGIVMD